MLLRSSAGMEIQNNSDLERDVPGTQSLTGKPEFYIQVARSL